MRLLITADLHYRPAQRDTFINFAQWVQEQQPDCFVIAGDVGHPLRLFQRGLQLFSDLPCPRLVIAGNHDVYRNTYSSQDLWQHWLPQVARDEGFGWLENDTLVLGTTAICGTMGWYDYSSRTPQLPYGPAEYRQFKGLVNHDADYVDWPWSDVAMARYLARGFASRLHALQESPDVQRVVAITHWPIFEESVPARPHSAFWNLLSAYMGNFTLGQLVRQQPKVTHVVSGHIHRPGHWTVAGAQGPIEFHIVGSRDGEPACVTLTLPD